MEKPYVIGIDMGGTNTSFGIVDARGNILNRGTIITTAYSNEKEYVGALGDAVNKLAEVSDRKSVV